jgi:hypothetical protein
MQMTAGAAECGAEAQLKLPQSALGSHWCGNGATTRVKGGSEGYEGECRGATSGTMKHFIPVLQLHMVVDPLCATDAYDNVCM